MDWSVVISVEWPGAPATDVRVRAHPDAELSRLLLELATLLGGEVPSAAEVDGRLLAAETRLGCCLRPGAELFPVWHPARQGRVAGGQHPRPLLELRVVAGPASGQVEPLAPGEAVLGRGPQADLSLADPALSRRHARLVVDSAGVRVVDLGSTNGTALVDPTGSSRVDAGDGRPGAALGPGAVLRVGGSTLQVHAPDGLPAALSERPGGRLGVHRPPRVRSVHQVPRLVLPAEPVAPERPGFPVVAVVLPLVLGSVVAVVLRQPAFLLFLVLSPLIALASAATERRAARRARTQASAQHARALAEHDVQLVAALRHDEHRRREDTPDLAALALSALQRRTTLWERRAEDDDVLSLRLGTADLPARVEVVGGGGGTRASPVLRGVPVPLDLEAVGVLGVAGLRRVVLGVARSLVLQAAVLHAPSDLGVVLLVDERCAEDWSWARWLPHLRPAGATHSDAAPPRGPDGRQPRTGQPPAAGGSWSSWTAPWSCGGCPACPSCSPTGPPSASSPSASTPGSGCCPASARPPPSSATP